TATSLPELVVDVSAIRIGEPDLAVGDLLGSSLMNLLILAVLDLMHRSRSGMLSRMSAAHALSGTMSIALTALAALTIISGKQLADIQFAGIGVGGWMIVLAFLLVMRLVFFDQKMAAEQTPLKLMPENEKQMSLPRAATGYIGAAVAIVLAGPFLARSASIIADESGLGGTFVGSTFVALCTSLPELVTSLVALRMGAFDLAVGNIYGSNSFNMVLLAPLDAVHSGPLFASISTSHLVTAMATILITSVAIAGQLYHAERRKRFIEPDATTIIALIILTFVFLYFLPIH
ncbi:MAG TPA: hypothetical protein PK402_01755, partial [Tepidisphaeraceae bacterium]|nr:hypothetical protein [Tepidisphaeraceae bacterium]